MKATEFCKFFDFTLYKKKGIDENGCIYNYIATDDQSAWHDRQAEKIDEIVDWFDACLDDYIIANLDEDGFEPKTDENYWEQALAWCEANDDYRETDTHDVIACLLNPGLIEDDAEVDYAV